MKRQNSQSHKQLAFAFTRDPASRIFIGLSQEERQALIQALATLIISQSEIQQGNGDE